MFPLASPVRRLVVLIVLSLPVALLAPVGSAQAATSATASPAALTLTSEPAFRGQVGVQFWATFRAEGATAPLRWSATGVPPGLWLDNTGVLRGLPVSAQTWSTTVRLTDAGGATASTTVRISIASRQGSLRRLEMPTTTDDTKLVALSSDGQWALVDIFKAYPQPNQRVIYHFPTRTITKNLTALYYRNAQLSGHYAWSVDGRYLVFWSQQPINGLSASPRVWRYDRVADRYEVLTTFVHGTGWGAWPVTSGDNRYLFFTTGDRSCGQASCTYRLDLTTQARVLVWGMDLFYGDRGNLQPGQVSTDGRYVTTSVNATAFDPQASPDDNRVVIKDLTTGTVRLIMRNGLYPTISGDDSKVALGFDSRAYLWSATTGLQTISRTAAGKPLPSPGVDIGSIRISTDGTTVEFLSWNNLFATPNSPTALHAYRYRIAGHSWQVLDVRPDGLLSDQYNQSSQELLNLPGHGGLVVFHSLDPQLMNTDRPAIYQWTAR